MGQPAIPAIQPSFAPPHMYNETPAQLVAHLSSPNGWYRDTAQRLIVLSQDKAVVPALQQLARSSNDMLARIHALWTLEGLGALDAPLARTLMKDQNPRMRIQAIRASETLYKAGDRTFADDYRAMTKDADPNVVIQAMATTNLFKLADAADVIKAAKAASQAKGVALVADHLLSAATSSAGRRPGTLTPEEEKRLESGGDVFNSVCAACHGPDGAGKALEGAAPGAMMAPPLAGSPRVQGHRDYVIKVLLGGLSGPLDGKTYSEVMAPLGSASTDEWVAGVASYVRSSFGNTGDLVTPADVARVRAATKSHKGFWTSDALAASLPRLIDPQSLTVTASHGADAAAGATSLRGWRTGAPQAAGMWLTIALPQPVAVTELQFDSAQSFGRGRSARLFGAGVAGRQDVEQARRHRQGPGPTHDDRIRARAREVRPHHADRHRRRRAGMVGQQSARVSGAVAGCGLPSAGCRPPSAVRRPPTADRRPPVTLRPASRMPSRVRDRRTRRPVSPSPATIAATSVVPARAARRRCSRRSRQSAGGRRRTCPSRP
jgi:mono/diheme cytochrome c family protein